MINSFTLIRIVWKIIGTFPKIDIRSEFWRRQQKKLAIMKKLFAPFCFSYVCQHVFLEPPLGSSEEPLKIPVDIGLKKSINFKLAW